MENTPAGTRRYLKCGWFLVLLTAISATGVVLARGLRFPAFDAIEPALITAGLCAGAAFYRRRKTPQFEMALMSLALITTFTAFYSVLMYAVGSIPTPLADRLLQSWDAACGAHLPDIVAWAQSHPTVNRLLRVAYDSMMLQTAGVIVLLSFTSDFRSLRGFNIQFMVSALLTMVLFAFFPADGPCACYDYVVGPGLDRYVDHLRELRSGVRDTVTWRNAEGLVTFPSFHTTWAFLLAWAVRRKKFLNVAAAMLNLAVIISTLTTGLHYFIDIPGGIAVAAVTIAIEARISRWCEQGSLKTTSRLERDHLPVPDLKEKWQGIPDADLVAIRESAHELQEV